MQVLEVKCRFGSNNAGPRGENAGPEAIMQALDVKMQVLKQ